MATLVQVLKALCVALPETTPAKLERSRDVERWPSRLALEVTQPPKEAKDMVKDAIMTTLGKKEFMSTTALAETVKKVRRHVIELPPSSVAFNSFCDDVVKTMRNSFQKVGRCRSNSTKIERLWRAFHMQSCRTTFIKI